MKTKFFLTAFFGLSLMACAQETPQVKHKKPLANTQKVKVVNTVDPVCNMKIAELVKDTAEYDHKIYGFCSAVCKDQFKKTPEKYVKK